MKQAMEVEQGGGTVVVALEVTQIRRDGGTQSRVALDEATVETYVVDMANGDEFPPVDVWFDGTHYWLSDGFHRIEAKSRIGHDWIMAKVHYGTLRDAILASASVNATHGLRRTNKDKERAVLRLLQDEEWGQWSDREIARRCHVSHPFVAKMRNKLMTGNVSSERTYVTRHGTVATMRTGNIGVNQEEQEQPEPLWQVFENGEETEDVTGNITSDSDSSAPVWKLESMVRAWQRDRSGRPSHGILLSIKDGKSRSPYWNSLVDYLWKREIRFKKSDLVQAVNNVLDQAQQDDDELSQLLNKLTLVTQKRIDQIAKAWQQEPREVLEKAVEVLWYMEQGNEESTRDYVDKSTRIQVLPGV